MAGDAVVSVLEQRLAEYLLVRRALGYKRTGKLLAQFVAWLELHDAQTITTDLALKWATLPAATGSNWHQQRLTVIRGFATHLHAIDPRFEVDHLEHSRGNSVRTRNSRLAAIRSLFRYAALKHPEHAATIERVLAIPAKRFDRALITFLTEPEIDALLAASDRGTWTGRRDHSMLLLAAQTGLRVSELIGLTSGDVHLGIGAHVNCLGKGRKERITPLTKQTVAVLRTWLTERAGQDTEPLFPPRTGRRLSRDAIEHRLAKHVATATEACPTLAAKTITPHVLRHYVDGWIMWPAGVFPLLGLSRCRRP